jgi:rare lipoprotein A
MTNTPESSRRASWYTHNENNFDSQMGLASYYRPGGRFKSSAMTAAHRSLPFGTRVRVTRIDTGNSVEVTINDRGPFIAGRIIDLSRAAASVLGMIGRGTARVKMSVLGR